MTFPQRKSRFYIAVSSLIFLIGLLLQEQAGFPLRLTKILEPNSLIQEPGCGAARAKLRISANQPGQLLENGRSIGKPCSKIKEVHELGFGRFRVKEGNLYFSSSDGTAPKANGRTYAFRYSPLPPRPLFILLMFVWLAASISLLKPHTFEQIAACWPSAERRDPSAFGQEFLAHVQPSERTILKLFASLLLSSLVGFSIANVLVHTTSFLVYSTRITLVCLIVILLCYSLSRLLRSMTAGLIATYLLILVLVFARVPLRTPLFFCAGILAIGYAIATLRLPRRDWASALMMAILTAATTVVIPNGYTSLDALQQLHRGDAFLDTLFHVSIAAMIKNYGEVSTGLHGLIEIPYYANSHALMAGISVFSQTSVIEVYSVATAVLFGPILVFSVTAACKCLDTRNCVAVPQAWASTCLFLALLPSLFLPWRLSNSFFRSESYLVSLGIFCISLPVLYKRNLSWWDIGLSALAVISIAGCKASVALVFVTLWSMRVLVLWMLGSPPWLDLVGLAVVLLAVLALSSRLVTTHSEGAFKVPFHYIRDSFAGDSLNAVLNGKAQGVGTLCQGLFAIITFCFLHFFLSWIVLAEAVHRRGFSALLKSPAAAYSLAALGMGLAIACTVTLTHGAAYYFTSVALFVALPGAVALSGGWIQSRVFSGFGFSLVCLSLISAISYNAYSSLIKRSVLTDQAKNGLILALLDTQKNSDKDTIFQASPEALAASPFADCKTRPFVFPAVSERPWLNVIEAGAGCDLTNYGFEQYGIFDGHGPVAVAPKVPPGMKLQSFPFKSTPSVLNGPSD